MFLTANLLRTYDACEQGIKYMERFYPYGAEMIDIIRDIHISKEFLHWGRENLSHNEEELAAYCEACHIVNSDGFWYSCNVLHSSIVIRSNNVTQSGRVFYSADVDNSFDIVNSDTILTSKQVFESSMVTEGLLIAHCHNVIQSENICFSTMVFDSINVYDSKNIFNSSEIIKCEDVTDSYFCQECKNIKHCMFCVGLEDAEYYLFNKPVDKNRFELFLQQYKRFMQDHLAFAPSWPKNMIADCAVSITPKFDEWYKPISEKFWKWAETLPGFDPMLLYNITMNSQFLVN